MQRAARLKRLTILEVIPELYQKARMCHLLPGLRQVIDGLPAWKGLFLWGPPGVGKTYAMAAIARRLVWRGVGVERILFSRLCTKVRATYHNAAKQSEEDIVSHFIKPQALLIEDVGTMKSIGERETDFSRNTFHTVLDERMEHCRPTFITSNKNVEDLAHSFDSRIASRIQQACEVRFLEGPDRRTEQKGGE